ncbi:IST1 homolog [Chenopodium quinoa]|uniref:IST1 homolog n=1 Tax=Chenopodium quinoa TaxID=63459 RepID=UPI000B78E4E3|nr:IST1 homolog [Chenopodium quinoa]
MSMLDSFFAKGFKGSKCKTLLKLSVPRIKLLRNRRELHIKQMRKDIAKLLETGQEATARIRVEHIVREENMMAAQEIIELFCELIAVRLPIIESQRECPLDLKEAISSICFAAPRCADLPELLQVQMSFAAKYGKEFVAAATELMPDCGVNRQLVELLSVRAPSAEKKLKLLKEIAEEHELEWDPSPSESELFKSHEDLLNGPKQFVGGSKVPLPKEKHDEVMQSTSVQESAAEPSGSEESFDELEFPEVPKGSLRPSADAEVLAPPPQSDPLKQSNIDTEDTLWSAKHEPPKSSATPGETKQFLPFISPPSSLPSASLPVKESSPPPPPSMASKAKSDDYLNFHDVLAAANAAADSAERAAAAARSAASLAEARISEFSKSKSGIQSPDSDVENPFHASNDNLSAATEKLQLDDRNASGDDVSNPWVSSEHFGNDQNSNVLKHATSDEASLESDSYPPGEHTFKQEAPYPHQPQRIPSMDDDPEFTYPNLFSSHSSGDNSQSRHGS